MERPSAWMIVETNTGDRAYATGAVELIRSLWHRVDFYTDAMRSTFVLADPTAEWDVTRIPVAAEPVVFHTVGSDVEWTAVAQLPGAVVAIEASGFDLEDVRLIPIADLAHYLDEGSDG